MKKNLFLILAFLAFTNTGFSQLSGEEIVDLLGRDLLIEAKSKI